MFIDRRDAAEKLALELAEYRNKDVLVLGIPRGGVETAYYVAKYLNAELSMVITRKLGFPLSPEAAFGAIAEDGSTYIADLARQTLTTSEMNEVIKEQKLEIQRRIEKLRSGKPLPEMKDRIVIIVDDGIATGATLFATIELCRQRKPRLLIVAAPIAGKRMQEILRKKVDEVVILEKPNLYHAVSQGYEEFYNLTDEETLAFMRRWELELAKR